MTHSQAILEYLKTHGGSATLGELLDATLSAFRRSASDFLLEKGYSREAVADALGHTTEKIVDAHYASKKHAPYRRDVTHDLVVNFK